MCGKQQQKDKADRESKERRPDEASFDTGKEQTLCQPYSSPPFTHPKGR